MSTRYRMPFQAALLTCLGLAGSGLCSSAQSVNPASGSLPSPHLRQKNDAVVDQVVTLPGRGQVTLHLLKLPRAAVHKMGQVSGSHHHRYNAPTPTLFSSTSDYTSVGDTFTGEHDALWTFPTIGFDPANVGFQYGVPNTIESGAPAPNNTADIAFGQIGNTARISDVILVGGVADVTSFTPKDGTIFIALFDGVDGTTPPNFANNVAYLRDTDGNGNKYDGYTVDFTASDGFAVWDIDARSNPWVLKDPQGRFGILVAKISGGVVTSEWIGYVGSPNGPNQVWEITNNNYSSVASLYFATPADNKFNQGAANIGTYNYFYELHGTNGDGTNATRGTLQGNIRRRGINVPNNTNVKESAPGAYSLIAYAPGTKNIVRQDYFFTQPSYNANGSLTVNYKLDGYPAGTYDIEIRQVPVQDVNHKRDTIWAPTVYPFGDYIPAFVPNVVVPNNSSKTLNARLERAGDLTDDGTLNQPDGYVDINDLGAFAFAYGSASGQPKYNAKADLTGDTSDPSNPLGYPDGFIDINDLGVFAALYGTGNFEQP